MTTPTTAAATKRAFPEWVDNPIGRALLDAILSDPPETRIVRDDWGHHPTYFGKPASLLRRLHREWIQHELGALDRMFAVTHIWQADEADAIMRVEEPDALIARVLADRKSDNVAWLERAGPIAKRLNAEARKDRAA